MNSKACIWRIQVPSGRQIQLNFNNFTLEDSSECKFDRLVIRNGGLATSPLLGTFCGTEKPPILKSFSNQLFVNFVSDTSRTDVGFEIEWTSTLTGCGGTLTSYMGSISSPNFPDTYSENALCTWRIVISEGSKVQMVFTDLDMESDFDCRYDYVEIYDGKDPTARALGRYCDSTRHPLEMQTSTNFAFVRFRSDASNAGRGFNMRYISNCNVTLTGYHGVNTIKFFLICHDIYFFAIS